MIQTMNPYNATTKTAEIMSRYRPIAPKPETPIIPNNTNTVSEIDHQSSLLPQNIRKSPYLRNVWAHLQARPTRTRKRGRTASFAPPPSSLKRARTCLQGLLSPPPPPPYNNNHLLLSPTKNLAMHGFSLVPLNCGLDTAVTTLAESVASAAKVIDLNMEAAEHMPKELDFMQQLKDPVKPKVISPRPVRPIGSKILVTGIITDGDKEPKCCKWAEEVEEEVEAESVPVIVSDSSNRVRLTNSAYKEMMGQPECCWLDCVSTRHGGRIGGEVLLQFGDCSKAEMLSTMHAFTCNGKIEWESDGNKRCVDVTCQGVKLACEAKDYKFLWKFHLVQEE